MRKLTFAMNLSLDGYIAAPGDDRRTRPRGRARAARHPDAGGPGSACGRAAHAGPAADGGAGRVRARDSLRGPARARPYRGIPIARPARSGRGRSACARAIRSIRSSSAGSAALARSVVVSTWSSICSAVAISASSSAR